MMRKAPATSMQKTYDECYLICSTAIYFEGQNNEAEALRAWRNALDQIYYHNAYKIPSNYSPRSETERALADSLKAMEMQCKERVDLLEALKKSRLEAAKAEKEAAKGGSGSGPGSPFRSRESLVATTPSMGNPTSMNGQGSTWLGNNTVPQATYADIPRPPPTPERRPPAQPPRPSFISKHSSRGDTTPHNMSIQSQIGNSPHLTPPAPSSAERTRDRTPSPEKKNGGMLKTLRSGNAKEGRSSSSKITTTLRPRAQPAAASAAALSWSKPSQSGPSNAGSSSSISTTTYWDPVTRTLVRGNSSQQDARRASDNSYVRPPSPSDYRPGRNSHDNQARPPYPDHNPFANFDSSNDPGDYGMPPPPPPHKVTPPTPTNEAGPAPSDMTQMPPTSLSYMKEYPNNPPLAKKVPPPIPSKPDDRKSDSDGTTRKAKRIIEAGQGNSIPRKAIGRAAGVASATAERQKLDNVQAQLNSRTRRDPQTAPTGDLSSSPDTVPKRNATKKKIEGRTVPARAMTPPTTDDADGDSDIPGTPSEKDAWEARVKQILKKLPKGVDETAAKQIFNEIVIQGDEVHWDDVAGLEIAKSALKETVVYPFLRPDLFMGLREPARGMLLFGPPGTGKTMLARAVATESKSVFFAISASSLTSKFLGESEKLVRALFVLAKELAPAIIFVDEIDSLLGSRGGSSEHEATRRIKTEFLIQWSDLQKAAAGRESTEGDASRVLVLAATNLPWAIDEAARRRFVRRQYIPLPENWVREKQLRTLLAAQKHNLRDRDLKVLVGLTDGFSGSDITALAKDAAMGPLRSLGEKLLHMSPEDIRPIGMQDFEASLVNIRPSVSKQGLKEFEDWASEFGERGG
ncbi:Putative AAA+ ATPase domain, ATPase, AAA-type, core, Vps4 oligomerization [Septoria linicola]|uniref:AAA+ ATPase domain, ATPase, AAA-type, core, Vps4 oligomerization n=1 Tax=Septoria linicola TaxID=215465 RepID=A0A9Q9B1W7_9PEZI|nr:Putative AAA+ ATPase domain, ATPase, AAA-type, core, Vps4 oligomerization [Septoria linicola]